VTEFYELGLCIGSNICSLKISRACDGFCPACLPCGLGDQQIDGVFAIMATDFTKVIEQPAIALPRSLGIVKSDLGRYFFRIK